jgi:hypothetical protein
MISANNLMIVMIFSGIALCGAYFRAQYMDWCDQQTAEIEKRLRVRLLYRDELSRPQESAVVPVVDLVGVRVNTEIPEAVEATGHHQTLPLRNAA